MFILSLLVDKIKSYKLKYIYFLTTKTFFVLYFCLSGIGTLIGTEYFYTNLARIKLSENPKKVPSDEITSYLKSNKIQYEKFAEVQSAWEVEG